MDKTLSEVFGEFTYSQSMSYEDLLNNEQKLLENLDRIFLDAGAEYLDFTPLGDILKLQCGFETHDLDLFQEIARKIAGVLPGKVRGRLVCLQKNLNSFHIYWLTSGQWQEADIELPAKAPEHLPLHKLEDEKKI
ncbi:MAG: hypothetical protein K2H64_08820 [Desulfovibrio sp.]|nr:hypothetical protein [Desulfovibrio sp.]